MLKKGNPVSNGTRKGKKKKPRTRIIQAVNFQCASLVAVAIVVGGIRRLWAVMEKRV